MRNTFCIATALEGSDKMDSWFPLVKGIMISFVERIQYNCNEILWERILTILIKYSQLFSYIKKGYHSCLEICWYNNLT